MKKKIAITGGIGSGKSSVLRYLGELGYPIYSCDEIYREIIQMSTYIEKIKVAFPDCVLNGKIDKKLLAKKVFKNQENLQILNSIAHPLIMEKLLKQMDACKSEIVFAEVPLLFEGNYENLFDVVIVVLREKKQRIQAIMERDQITKEEAENRIASQFDYDAPCSKTRLKNCNIIFLNNADDLYSLKTQIRNLKF